MSIVTTNWNNNHEHVHEDVESTIPMPRDIHALSPPSAPQAEPWETISMTSSTDHNFTNNSLVVAAGSTVGTERELITNSSNLGSLFEETNPLAIVVDDNPTLVIERSSVNSVEQVKKEEVSSRISAWQSGKVAKINNRFKREESVIRGWEGEQIQKANSWMNKVERKLEEKRAKALEKMQNDIAMARKKADERRASSESKRGTKVARILEIANVMRAIGQAPSKRSFF